MASSQEYKLLDMISETHNLLGGQYDEEEDEAAVVEIVPDCSSPGGGLHIIQYFIRHISILPAMGNHAVSLALASSYKLTLALLPSFVASRISGTPSRKKHNNIAALDGLRGVACLFVFHEHWTFSFGNCLAAKPEVLSSRIMNQPYINLLWSGIAMVDIFFFMSGYVLVCKPLKLIHSGDRSGTFSSLSSAVFRRALRLYLPSFAIILVAAVLTRFHAFDASNAVFFRQPDHFPLGPQEQPPPFLETWWLQLWDALKDCFRIADNTIPWGRFNIPYEVDKSARPAATIYDRHLWTIPVEFRSSMLIFMALIGTTQICTRWRFLIHLVLWLDCLFTERFAESLFLAGMIFAEIDVIKKEKRADNNAASSTTVSRDFRSHRLGGYIGNAIYLITFVFGLFLVSVPRIAPEAFPAYAAIMVRVPRYIREKHCFVRAIGGILTTWPVANSSLLAPLFTNPISHYLGQISFPLYLVHGTVIKSLGYGLMPKFFDLGAGTQDKTHLTSEQFARTWLIGYAVLLPVVIWGADLFWRAVDRPCVSFAKYVEEKLRADERKRNGLALLPTSSPERVSKVA